MGYVYYHFHYHFLLRTSATRVILTGVDSMAQPVQGEEVTTKDLRASPYFWAESHRFGTGAMGIEGLAGVRVQIVQGLGRILGDGMVPLDVAFSRMDKDGYIRHVVKLKNDKGGTGTLFLTMKGLSAQDMSASLQERPLENIAVSRQPQDEAPKEPENLLQKLASTARRGQEELTSRMKSFRKEKGGKDQESLEGEEKEAETKKAKKGKKGKKGEEEEEETMPVPPPPRKGKGRGRQEEEFDEFYIDGVPLHFKGFIDRIDGSIEEKEVVLADYKTGSSTKYTKRELSDNIQATVYSLWFKEKYGFYPKRFVFIFTKERKTKEIEIDHAFIERGLARIKRITNAIEQGIFIPEAKGGKYFCKNFCNYFDECPKYIKSNDGWDL